MTEIAQRLHATADEQIGTLIALLSTIDQATLQLPCPGREKLGDGTIGASAKHTADNYQRIAKFITTSSQMSMRHAAGQRGGHRTPRFLRALGHGPQDHAQRSHGPGGHDNPYSAETVELSAVLQQLTGTRETLARIAELSDNQLRSFPPKDSFRFCDGQRTLEQVLDGLLTHQSHQLDALQAAAA